MSKTSKSFFWSRKLAKTLKRKGVVAYFGSGWQGSSTYKDPEFWYFHSCSDGKIGAYVEYDGGTYDSGIIARENFKKAFACLDALGINPSREEIWTAMKDVVTATHARSATA